MRRLIQPITAAWRSFRQWTSARIEVSPTLDLELRAAARRQRQQLETDLYRHGRNGPVAKFVSEPKNGRIGSAFKLGCPRMAGVKGSLGGPIQWPFSNFATGP